MPASICNFIHEPREEQGGASTKRDIFSVPLRRLKIFNHKKGKRAIKLYYQISVRFNVSPVIFSRLEPRTLSFLGKVKMRVTRKIINNIVLKIFRYFKRSHYVNLHRSMMIRIGTDRDKGTTVIWQPNCRSISRSVGRSIGRPVDRLVGRSGGRSVDRSVGRSVGQSLLKFCVNFVSTVSVIM